MNKKTIATIFFHLLKHLIFLAMSGLMALLYYEAGRIELFDLNHVKCDPVETTIEMEINDEN